MFHEIVESPVWIWGEMSIHDKTVIELYNLLVCKVALKKVATLEWIFEN